MSEIQRYGMMGLGPGVWPMWGAPEGEFVSYADHIAETSALKQEIADNEVRIGALEQKYADCPHPKPLDSYGSILECGCSYDKPSDLCCAHAPLVTSLRAENARLSAPVSDEEVIRALANTTLHRDRKRVFDALIAARKAAV